MLYFTVLQAVSEFDKSTENMLNITVMIVTKTGLCADPCFEIYHTQLEYTAVSDVNKVEVSYLLNRNVDVNY